MKPNKLLVLQLTIVLFTGNLFAQREFKPGYIVTITGDTMLGLIDNKSSSASLYSCLFKKTEADEPVSYSADDINEYRFESGRYFVSYRLINSKFEQKIFFEYLLKGKVHVYKTIQNEVGNSYYIKKDSLFVSLDNSERPYTDSLGVKYILNSQRYKGQLNYLMSDQPQIKSQINQTNMLSGDKLLKISKKYHNMVCPDEACIEYSKNGKRIKVHYGLEFEFKNSQLMLDKYVIPLSAYFSLNYNFKKSTGLSLGIPIEFQFVNFNRKLSTIFTPGISSYHFNSDRSWESNGNIFEQNTIDIDITMLNIPVCIKYSLNSSHWRVWPYVGIGFQFSYFIKENSNFCAKRDYYGYKSEQTSSDFDFSGYQNSIFGVIGLEIPIGKFKTGIFMKYEAGDGIHRLKYLDSFLKISKTNTVSAGISWFF